jgi:AcrR family transcriptional regulator
MTPTNGFELAEITGEKTDGRRQRSEASRGRIVRAMLELISAGDVSPSAEDVAKHAGVGLRSVFRHFDNMESLYREIDSLITAEVIPIVERPLTPGSWDVQLQEVLDKRVRIFERIMPFKIAADVHQYNSPFLEERMAFFARMQREALLTILPNNRRKETEFVDGLDLVLSFDTWRRLRKEQQLSAPKARRVLEFVVAKLAEGLPS